MRDLDPDAKDMMDSLASIDRVKYEEWKHEPLDPNDPRVIEPYKHPVHEPQGEAA